MTTSPIAFDHAALAALAKYTSEDQLRGYFATFFDELETLMQELASLTRAEVRFRVHRLASGAWAIGLPDLADAAVALDRALGSELGEAEADVAIAVFGELLELVVNGLEPESVLRTLYGR